LPLALESTYNHYNSVDILYLLTHAKQTHSKVLNNKWNIFFRFLYILTKSKIWNKNEMCVCVKIKKYILNLKKRKDLVVTYRKKNIYLMEKLNKTIKKQKFTASCVFLNQTL
jgi:hypothetical protein